MTARLFEEQFQVGITQILVAAETAGETGNTNETEAQQFITPIAGDNSVSLTGVVAGGDDEKAEPHQEY